MFTHQKQIGNDDLLLSTLPPSVHYVLSEAQSGFLLMVICYTALLYGALDDYICQGCLLFLCVLIAASSELLVRQSFFLCLWGVYSSWYSWFFTGRTSVTIEKKTDLDRQWLAATRFIFSSSFIIACDQYRVFFLLRWVSLRFSNSLSIRTLWVFLV